jgi:hypothetical protein
VRIPGSEFPGRLKTDLPGARGTTPSRDAPGAPVRGSAGSSPDIQSGFPKGNSGARIPAVLSSLLSQLKLPLDGLSVSIVSFAQFFSLPLNPALLAKVRRQTVSATPPGGRSGENADPAIREARSLACIAALGKGAELSAESLDRYARLISGRPVSPEPPGGKDGDGGEDQGNTGPGFGNDGSPGNPETGKGSGGEGEGNPKDGRNRSGNPETLRDIARKAEADEPLLELLNRMPGKDGKRWLAIPLPIDDGGVRLQATLRLLLAPSAGTPGEVEQMALEIQGERRRWLFSYRPGAALQAALWPETGEKERAGLERELAACLGLPPGQVKVTGWNPVFAPDCRNDRLFSIREEV